jgi:bifunctional lysine-specific demethylase and histidyl-hydroxylase NO66
LAAAQSLTGATPLRRREYLRARLDADADGARLVLGDRTITFPAVAAEALKFVLEADAVTADALPGLDPDDQAVIARRLLREGVLVPA